ncbi:MAG TPA: MFS transporter, partial [Streptosporangiaceae bacterium]|nr:MFS transporter [Streptosporangiaceae bacterium]
MSAARPGEPSPPALARRLVPLRAGVVLQGLLLWVPVEKLFQTQIGFSAASIGLAAAAYAAVVPLLEVPSGILADRWSRSKILMVASVALAASSLLGGLSTNVGTYIAAAMILGVYFALNSGTVDSIVYDTVLEETGSSALYEKWIGRVRIAEGAAFAASALAGGVVAEWTSPRLTYFLTVPFALSSLVAFARFDEPQLHRAAERQLAGQVPAQAAGGHQSRPVGAEGGSRGMQRDQPQRPELEHRLGQQRGERGQQHDFPYLANAGHGGEGRGDVAA